MAFQPYKQRDSSALASALAPVSSQAGPMPADIKAQYDQYTSGSNPQGGIPNSLLQYAQAHPEAGIDRSGNNYQVGTGAYNFYNPVAGQTPGQDWWFADDRNLPSGGFSGQQNPYAPVTNSPEANKAITHSNDVTTQKPPMNTRGFNSQSEAPRETAQAPQAPAAPPPTYQAPLQLSGKSNQDQAKALATYLQQQGVNVDRIVVGGTSPYDTQINSLINQINDPNTTDAQRRSAAQQIGNLINQRNSSATGDVSQYDMKTGTFLPAGGTTSGGAGQPSLTTTPAIRSMIERLLGQFSQGNTEALDERRRWEEGHAIQDIENASLTRRQQLAERLAANGITGGIANDAMSREEMNALAARDTAIGNLDSSIFQQQEESKRQALAAILQMQGMDQATANQMAQLSVQRELGLGNLATTERGQDISLALGNNSQQMQLLMHLLDLAWAGDQTAQAKVDAMIQQLIAGGAQ